MKEIKFNRIFQILYPMLVYFVIYQFGFSLLKSLLGNYISPLGCLLLAAIICFFPLLMIFRAYPKLIANTEVSRKDIAVYCCYILVTVIAGLLSNVIITNSGLIESSANFESASDVLTAGSFTLKVACNVLAIPILEELLIRGIVCGQIYMWHGAIPAVIISSIFFGILHNNIVQFIYAVIIGIFLGTMYIKTKRLSLCIIAHGLINLLVIIIANI